MNARFETLHPDPDKQGTNIDRALYETVRAAILEAVGHAGDDGVGFSRLSTEVQRRTPPETWSEHSPGWYTTVVKLDLEARGLVGRRTQAGRQVVVRR